MEGAPNMPRYPKFQGRDSLATSSRDPFGFTSSARPRAILGSSAASFPVLAANLRGFWLLPSHPSGQVSSPGKSGPWSGLGSCSTWCPHATRAPWHSCSSCRPLERHERQATALLPTLSCCPRHRNGGADLVVDRRARSGPNVPDLDQWAPQ